MQPPRKFDPSIIDVAPLEEEPSAPQDAKYVGVLEDLTITLQTELEEAKAELSLLKGSKTFNQVKASMLEPYANSVFRFVMWYCIVVAILLISAGNSHKTGFHLSDTILAIISGSTAVSVIGLIGMVISGLFHADGSKP